MDSTILNIVEKFGIPVAGCAAMGYFLMKIVFLLLDRQAKQEDFIRQSLLNALERNTAAFERMNQTMSGCVHNNDRSEEHDHA